MITRISNLVDRLFPRLAVQIVWNHCSPDRAVYEVIQESGLPWREISREDLKQLVVAAHRISRS